ncbi:hypothetical protein MPLA_760049 [Mesorhizobium sp. ORS 3359]|nr:hypothetical protein MPLA_760049 [Mesorhizobium sp. ORS 3359]
MDGLIARESRGENGLRGYLRRRAVRLHGEIRLDGHALQCPFHRRVRRSRNKMIKQP